MDTLALVAEENARAIPKVPDWPDGRARHAWCNTTRLLRACANGVRRHFT